MTPEERRASVRDHRTAIFGYNRAADGPAMSIVYHVMQPDTILVSTMGARAKAKAVARHPKVSLWVLDESDISSGLTHWTSAALPWHDASAGTA
jgi:hypothetical protein